MKINKNIIKNALCATAVTAMASLAVSCDDMLDTKPQGQFTDNQVGPEEASDLMTAAYATLTNHYFGNNESFAGPINNWVFDLRSDDSYKGGGDLGQENYMYQLEVGNVQSNNPIADFKWRNNYFSIDRCNTAIKAIQNSPLLSDAEKAQYIGEMKTLRSYYWFDMYRIFKIFPYFDETCTNPSQVSTRDHDRAEIYAAICNDLRESYNNLSETRPTVTRFNKYVAAAVLAKVAVFESDWETAEEYAGYVMGSGQFSLYPNFLDMSKPEYNGMYETVFTVFYNSVLPDNNGYNFNNCLNCTVSTGGGETGEDGVYGNGDDFHLGSQNLVNAYRTDANGLPYLDGSFDSQDVDAADYAGNVDPRLDFTFGRIGMPWRSHPYTEKWCRNLDLFGQYSCKKPYPAPENQFVKVGVVPWGASTLNESLIRYADIMLIKAEALIEQNKDLDQARNIINQIRKRAMNSVDANYLPVDVNPMIANYACSEYPSAGWNQNYARQALRMERRLELAMEGHRWFDLVRWGIAVETMNAYYQSESAKAVFLAGGHLSEADLFLPVPLDQKENAGGLYD